MGATNTTTNYSLSQFISTDKPAWLQDYNGDMLKIDTAIKSVDTAAQTAQTTANNAVSASGTNASDISALQTTVGGLNTTITNLQLAVNTIQSLIGNGTPTTTDQTIIGAINEINAMEGNNNTETVCGKFKNKTLYRRVLEADVSFAANTDSIYEWNNVNGMVDVVKMECIAHQTDGAFGSGTNKTGSFTSFCFANPAYNKAGYHHYGSVAVDHIQLIIEYTKV